MAYATTADLTTYLGGEAVPDNAATLLERASTKLDAFLIGAYYQTDDNEQPTEPSVITALREATCAQVQYWAEIGDLTGTGTGSGWRDVTIGNVRLSRVSGGSGQSGSDPAIAPTVVDILRVAGLLPIAPWLWG